MCTILTIDREFFDVFKDSVLERITKDAVSNDDGFGLILLGKTKRGTIVTQSIDLETIKTLINNVPWERMFLHSRMSTTSTSGIFGCHNFSSVGEGKSQFTAKGLRIAKENWLVQHNGVLRDAESRKYMVDSMYIAEVINKQGLQAALTYINTKEDYANVFLVNPDNGRYFMSRSSTGSLHTDGYGNYSTHPLEIINQPVKDRTITEHHHKFENNAKKKIDKKVNKDELIELWSREAEQIMANLEEDCKAWGDYVLFQHTSDFKMFAEACEKLGYMQKNVQLSRNTFNYLNFMQQRWIKALRIDVEPAKNKKKKGA